MLALLEIHTTHSRVRV